VITSVESLDGKINCRSSAEDNLLMKIKRIEHIAAVVDHVSA